MSAESKQATLELVMWVASGKPDHGKPAWLIAAEQVCPERLPEIMEEAETVLQHEVQALAHLDPAVRTAVIGVRTVVALATIN